MAKFASQKDSKRIMPPPPPCILTRVQSKAYAEPSSFSSLFKLPYSKAIHNFSQARLMLTLQLSVEFQTVRYVLSTAIVPRCFLEVLCSSRVWHLILSGHLREQIWGVFVKISSKYTFELFLTEGSDSYQKVFNK